MRRECSLNLPAAPARPGNGRSEDALDPRTRRVSARVIAPQMPM
jgi:hypothetical protein